MMTKRRGFFSSMELEQLPKTPLSSVPKCGACGLFKHCSSPKMKPSGDGRKRILLVGEAPGENEDQIGRQFVGKAGQYLQQCLRKVGIDMKRDCWLHNAIVCRPTDKEGKNRSPTPKEIDYCRPNLSNAIKELDPNVVIILGGVPLRSMMGLIWKENPGLISQWVGFQIPCQRPNAWVCPTWQPSYLLREKDKRPVVEKLFLEHLDSATKLTAKPWKTVPDYRSMVRCVYDPEDVATTIRTMLDFGATVAFDYETDRLKPDAEGSRIVSCAVSNGINTIAYPWVGKAIDATRELIRSEVPKIASNMKFEDRWTRRVFGHGVRNWNHDTMLMAHTLDNRKGITGLKFQAFILLGMDEYDKDVHPYLESKGSNLPNRIKEVSLDRLLLYNGLDALLEVKVAEIQKARLSSGSE